MTAEPPTLRQALLESRTRLASCSDSPAADAEWLWGHALHQSRTWLLAYPEYLPTPAERSRGESLIQRRRDGFSVAHLCGGCDFLDFSLRLTPRVLAPRPETEMLVEQALHGLPRRARILEWGTGSGVLALALARARPDARILALDHSRTAVALAQGNALRLRLKNIRFMRGDWRGPWPGGAFDLILGNPPYVAPHDPDLQSPGVCREPRHALVSPGRGTQAIRTLAVQARRRAHRRTRLLLEHGADQGEACRRIVQRAGWGRSETLADLSGRARVCLARLQSGRTF